MCIQIEYIYQHDLWARGQFSSVVDTIVLHTKLSVFLLQCSPIAMYILDGDSDCYDARRSHRKTYTIVVTSHIIQPPYTTGLIVARDSDLSETRSGEHGGADVRLWQWP